MFCCQAGGGRGEVDFGNLGTLRAQNRAKPAACVLVCDPCNNIHVLAFRPFTHSSMQSQCAFSNRPFGTASTNSTTSSAGTILLAKAARSHFPLLFPTMDAM